MKRLLILLPVALALVACGPGSTAPPTSAGSVAPPTAAQTFGDHTKVDEQIGLTVTLGYTAAARAAKLAIDTGVIRDKATIARIGVLSEAAADKVDALRFAYLGGNSTDIATALSNARSAIALLLSASGDKP